MTTRKCVEALYVKTDSREVAITTPARVLWPEVGFTKKDLAEYYTLVAAVLLPHLVDRPVTLKRAPEGTTRPWWYQTECPSPPPWIRTTPVPGAKGDRTWNYCVVEDAATLLWLVNLGCIEFHPLLVRCSDLSAPTTIVFDLDPGDDVGLGGCCEVALMLRTELESRGLTSFVKTSGGSGLHVVVPLANGATFEQTRWLARDLGETLAGLKPRRVTARVQRQERTRRVFVDWKQNGPYKSIPAPFSVRLMRVPLVSMPLAWQDVEQAIDGDDAALLFTPARALQVIQQAGDPWAGIGEVEQELVV